MRIGFSLGCLCRENPSLYIIACVAIIFAKGIFPYMLLGYGDMGKSASIGQSIVNRRSYVTIVGHCVPYAIVLLWVFHCFTPIKPTVPQKGGPMLPWTPGFRNITLSIFSVKGPSQF